MNHHHRSSVESILAGTAEVVDGCISIVGDSGEELFLPVVEVLDEASTSPLYPPTLRRECLVALPATCATYGALPSRYSPTGHLVIQHQSTICVSGANVWRGALGGVMVTVRSIPYNLTGPSGHSQESAYKEVITWKNLNHPNILPLLGVDTSISPFSTISAWMEYGTLREYLVHFPDAPRFDLLFGVSQGLEYMHNLDCIHGDLKSFNILVSDDHSATLANFRLASFLQESEVNAGVRVQECDPWSSPRWLAPELLFPEDFGLDCKRCTKETDIYAFVMVMYEAFSGSFPFEGLRDEALILRVRSGDHPRRPKGGLDLGLTDELWDMMKSQRKQRDIFNLVVALMRHSYNLHTRQAEIDTAGGPDGHLVLHLANERHSSAFKLPVEFVNGANVVM